MHAVLLAGGWAHPGTDLIATMTEIMAARQITLEVVTDAALAPEALSPACDLLIVGACWFSMTDDRYTDEQRAEHAVPLNAALAERLDALRSRGCPVLAMHTAVICFDGDPIWSRWLGGTWNWQTSWHPEPAAIEVQEATGSPVSIESFAVVDELYQGLDVSAEARVVAESTDGYPLAWTHRTATGRAAVDVLGHDARSLDDPRHRDLILSLVEWLLAGSTTPPRSV